MSGGTTRVKDCSLPLAPDRPVTGTPSASEPPPPGGGSTTPPAAAATAAAASTMPLPIGWSIETGNARSVSLRAASTSAGLKGDGATACIIATTPATCGEAIEVPE